MATSFPYGSSFEEATYRAGVTLESERATFLSALEGTTEDHALQIHDREGLGRGATVTLYFSPLNDEAPHTRSSQILGNESGTLTYSDDVALRYFGKSGGVENTIADQEQISIDLKNRERSRISLEWAQLREKWVLNHLAGNVKTTVTGATDYGFSGGNLTIAQDSSHIYYTPGASAHTTDAGVGGDSTAILTTDVIDELVARSQSKDYVAWPIVPAVTPFGRLFVFVTSHIGFRQMRQNSSASDIYDLSKAMIQGGKDADNNMLFTGQGFIYNRTLVLASDFVPSSATQADARYSVFFGAGAIDCVRGENFTGDSWLGWAEHQALRKWTCLADTVQGVNRRIVNGESWGSFRVVHYDDGATTA